MIKDRHISYNLYNNVLTSRGLARIQGIDPILNEYWCKALDNSIWKENVKYISPILLSEDILDRLNFVEYISWFYQYDDRKQISLAKNDVNRYGETLWYVFIRNENIGEADDLVCLRSDLIYLHELQDIFSFLSRKWIYLTDENF